MRRGLPPCGLKITSIQRHDLPKWEVPCSLIFFMCVFFWYEPLSPGPLSDMYMYEQSQMTVNMYTHVRIQLNIHVIHKENGCSIRLMPTHKSGNNAEIWNMKFNIYVRCKICFILVLTYIFVFFVSSTDLLIMMHYKVRSNGLQWKGIRHYILHSIIMSMHTHNMFCTCTCTCIFIFVNVYCKANSEFARQIIFGESRHFRQCLTILDNVLLRYFRKCGRSFTKLESRDLHVLCDAHP